MKRDRIETFYTPPPFFYEWCDYWLWRSSNLSSSNNHRCIKIEARKVKLGVKSKERL